RRILLIDDVMTTGATAAACALALKRAGGQRVALLTVARVDRRMDAWRPAVAHSMVGERSRMISERLQKPVLVLNASYEPINICGARRALVLVLKGVASAEEASTHAIHSARASRRLPSVIRLLVYRRIAHQTGPLSPTVNLIR